jgi:hypothetical protein
MNAACTPNGAAMRFVPGSGIILQSSVLSPTFARRGRECLPPNFFTPRRTRRRLLVSSSLQFDSMVLRAYGSNHGGALSFRRKRQKNPAEGTNRTAGCCEPEAEARVTFHQANLVDAFIKGGRCRFDSRLWNPEIIDCALPAPVSHVGQPSGLHWMSVYPRKRTNSRHLRRPALCQKMG